MNWNKFRPLARRWWHQEVRPLLIFALVMFSLRSSLADWNKVPTGSMKPTILEGDRVWVNKLAYDLKVPFTTWHLAEWGNPQRGDVVVFFSPKDGTRLVKRVIGLPGDTVELRDEQLRINGRPVDYAPLEPEISAQLSEPERASGVFATEKLPGHTHAVMAIKGVPAMRTFGPTPVPAGQYFMMGDNRDNSFDSRYFGTVDRDQIVGRVSSVVLSLDQSHYWLPRWNRTGSALDKPAQP
jgi:signal peptidase I